MVIASDRKRKGVAKERSRNCFSKGKLISSHFLPRSLPVLLPFYPSLYYFPCSLFPAPVVSFFALISAPNPADPISHYERTIGHGRDHRLARHQRRDLSNPECKWKWSQGSFEGPFHPLSIMARAGGPLRLYLVPRTKFFVAASRNNQALACVWPSGQTFRPGSSGTETHLSINVKRYYREQTHSIEIEKRRLLKSFCEARVSFLRVRCHWMQRMSGLSGFITKGDANCDPCELNV